MLRMTDYTTPRRDVRVTCPCSCGASAWGRPAHRREGMAAADADTVLELLGEIDRLRAALAGAR